MLGLIFRLVKQLSFKQKIIQQNEQRNEDLYNRTIYEYQASRCRRIFELLSAIHIRQSKIRHYEMLLQFEDNIESNFPDSKLPTNEELDNIVFQFDGQYPYDITQYNAGDFIDFDEFVEEKNGINITEAKERLSLPNVLAKLWKIGVLLESSCIDNKFFSTDKLGCISGASELQALGYESKNSLNKYSSNFYFFCVAKSEVRGIVSELFDAHNVLVSHFSKQHKKDDAIQAFPLEFGRKIIHLPTFDFSLYDLISLKYEVIIKSDSSFFVNNKKEIVCRIYCSCGSDLRFSMYVNDRWRAIDYEFLFDREHVLISSGSAELASTSFKKLSEAYRASF